MLNPRLHVQVYTKICVWEMCNCLVTYINRNCELNKKMICEG